MKEFVDEFPIRKPRQKAAKPLTMAKRKQMAGVLRAKLAELTLEACAEARQQLHGAVKRMIMAEDELVKFQSGYVDGAKPTDTPEHRRADDAASAARYDVAQAARRCFLRGAL
jgi:hypothetical protein